MRWGLQAIIVATVQRLARSSVCLLIVTHTLVCQDATSTLADSVDNAPQFRSLQIEAASTIFAYSVTVGFDYDLVGSDAGALGGRMSYDYIFGTDGDRTNELSILARSTLSLAFFRSDVYVGMTSQWPERSEHRFTLKYGADLRFRIFEPYFGLLVKASLVLGSPETFTGIVGLFLGYDGRVEE